MFEKFDRQNSAERTDPIDKAKLRKAEELAELPENYPGRWNTEDMANIIAQHLGGEWWEKPEYQGLRAKVNASLEKANKWLKENQWRGQA